MQKKHVCPRPPLFQALGSQAPPERIEIDGVPHELRRVLKHDSWAATALYAGAGQVVCKFNRIQPVFGVPMQWLGKFLARRELRLLRLFHDLPNVPRALGHVTVGGARCPTAVAREFIAGHPLGKYELVSDEFFPSLERLLVEVHQRDVAYADLQKHENIIVGDDGRPYLVDFQISFAPPRNWFGRLLPFRRILRLLQNSDRYHVRKHFARCRPDLFADRFQTPAAVPPWWIRTHRRIFRPFTLLRRRILILAGVRSSAGRADSEWFPEDAHRPQNAATR
ncbi:MAG: hypothetical protein JJ992_13070 [Planctomycetes bacterium]|nr:hypothetical protein [Planctomycetota bacterium]